jgi:hypothetical protein
MGRVSSQQPKPSEYSPEELGYQKYLEKKKAGWYNNNAADMTPEQKRWEQYAKDRRIEGMEEYKSYRDEVANVADDARTEKWKKFETETFGETPDKSATIEDLYMSADKKKWGDRQKDLYIDPKKKKKEARGGGPMTGGKKKPPFSGSGGSADVDAVKDYLQL